MRLEFVTYLIVLVIVIAIVAYTLSLIYGKPYIQPSDKDYREGVSMDSIVGDIIYLPPPRKVTNVSVEEAILWRRSIRDYTADPLTIDQLSMLLWAAYGVTETTWGLRAAPSAGATYPLEIYVVVGNRSVLLDLNKYLDAGVYKYHIHSHSLELVKRGDFRNELARAALDQRWVREAPVNIVITAVFERTTSVYGARGRERYVPMEVGHVGQNIYLMATALRLGTVVVGAFIDDWVARVVSASEDEVPMYIVPVGVPREFRETSFEEIYRFIERNRRR
ncbi:MAG: SagB/ThcOx family dehydrogenase [Ignisphaera sp.]